jgi:hypothetical protein
MIIHPATGYRIMPWANGRGQTVELLREDGPDGLHLRLSIATVTEPGPFSLLPNIDRVLTVISGPGFQLSGSGLALHAAPLTPVAFPGDAAIVATQVTAVSEDFNVMTARHLPAPVVWIAPPGMPYRKGRLFLLPLAAAKVNGQPLAARDLIETRAQVTIATDGPIIAVEVDHIGHPDADMTRT